MKSRIQLKIISARFFYVNFASEVIFGAQLKQVFDFIGAP